MMKKRLFLWVIVSQFVLCSQSFSVSKVKKELKKPVIVKIPTNDFPRMKLNTQFGLNLISGSAVISGFQFGKLLSQKTAFYLGPEISFMLFSPGSNLNVLVGGWLENSFFSDSRKTFDLGFYAGAGFANRLSKVKTTNFVALVDLAYTQRFQDNLALRAQIRPGYLGNTVICSLNFNAQFSLP